METNKPEPQEEETPVLMRCSKCLQEFSNMYMIETSPWCKPCLSIMVNFTNKFESLCRILKNPPTRLFQLLNAELSNQFAYSAELNHHYRVEMKPPVDTMTLTQTIHKTFGEIDYVIERTEGKMNVKIRSETKPDWFEEDEKNVSLMGAPVVWEKIENKKTEAE